MTTRGTPLLERLKTVATALWRGGDQVLKAVFAPLRKRPSLAVWVLILAIGAAWYWDVFATLDSWRKDWIYFNPAAEGVVIVDTPQLFTRERLVNERLLESEWIDDQIKGVSKKLKDGEFGRIAGLELTKLLIDIKNSGFLAAGNSANEDGAADSPNEALRILKDLGGLDPSPQSAFDAARNYREHLASQRYEAILDDAHDLGENTLHRLNFRLTLQPAASRTDSLAGISVVVQEAFSDTQILESYSKLVVETRKKLEKIAEQLLLDRAVIFNYNEPYSLEASEEERVDSILKEEYIKYYSEKGQDITNYKDRQSNIDTILREAVLLFGNESRTNISNQIKDLFANKIGAEYFE